MQTPVSVVLTVLRCVLTVLRLTAPVRGYAGSTAGIMCVFLLPCAAYLTLPEYQAEKAMASTSDDAMAMALAAACPDLRASEALRRVKIL
jgi:hypothetical protein